MSDIEPVKEKTLFDKIRDVEDVGLLHVKGYSNHEIASLLAMSSNDVKVYIEEYKKILNRKADDDPYFLERVQFNTIKALKELNMSFKPRQGRYGSQLYDPLNHEKNNKRQQEVINKIGDK